MLYFKSVAVLIHDVSNNLAQTSLPHLFKRSSKIHKLNTRFATHGVYEVEAKLKI